ncbi:exodeoxyribonuclease VII large subunit [Candidatus Saccharibacteria bacterium]|nr:exodeoxyribonuclease VII large subunit [Candidatus Saccharibacteria bacterium]
MFEDEVARMTPTQLILTVNVALEEICQGTTVVGEVASFKINQGKWVFFDLKDEESNVSCFMPVWDLRMPIEDGMKVVVRGYPKVTKWGKFSFTVQGIKPVGEGSLKKSFEILKKKLSAEGLFSPEKKRKIPEDLGRIGIISSTQAAGYADFIKILNARWGGIKVTVAHTQVQGIEAPDQIIRALNYFNERGDVQVIAILRGGGSADDLSAFNDEKLVRAIAASKIPVVTGIGHEVDESLVDLAADLRASTPSNAAELLTKDRKIELRNLKARVLEVGERLIERIEAERVMNRNEVTRISEGLVNKYILPMERENREKIRKVLQKIQDELKNLERTVENQKRVLEISNPEKVLSQGYAILAGKLSPGNMIGITTFEKEIKAEIKEIYERK